jgi:peptidoglycan/LPS O-acetylase OafA/YrhL
MTFTQNFWAAVTGCRHPNGVSHTWSLAIEEQFYLTLPLLAWLTSRRVLCWLMPILVGLAPVLRVVITLTNLFPSVEDANLILVFCRMDALGLGVCAALIARSPPLVERLRRAPYVLYGALIVGTVGMALTSYERPAWLFRHNFTLIAFFYFSLLLTIVIRPHSWISACFRYHRLQQLGILCYGLYLFHPPVLMLCQYWLLGRRGEEYPHIESLGGMFVTLLAFVLTVALASLSWYKFERPLVKMGHTLTY